MDYQDTPEQRMSVYLIRLGDTDYYKVGISCDVRARLVSLQTAIPFGLVLLRAIEQDDAPLIERDIHRALREYQVRNEWFRCDHETITQIFEIYNAMGIADSGLADPDVPGQPTGEQESSSGEFLVSLTLGDSILTFIREAGRPLATIEIENAMPNYSPKTVRNVLTDLKKSGKIRSESKRWLTSSL